MKKFQKLMGGGDSDSDSLDANINNNDNYYTDYNK